MTSTEYSIAGRISPATYEPLIERLSAFSQLGTAYEDLEIVCGAGPELAQVPRDQLRLRLTRSSIEKDPSWSLQVRQRPEPLRLSPDLLQRTVIECPVVRGSPRRVLRALGYEPRFEYVQRGVRFTRGIVTIEVYRLFESWAVEPIDNGYTVVLSARLPVPALPSRPDSGAYAPTGQEMKAEASSRIREVASTLQGLVELKRVD